jgi:hypothetical protein
MLKSTKDAYIEFWENANTAAKEYAQCWKNLFKSFGFTVYPYTTDPNDTSWQNRCTFRMDRGGIDYIVEYVPWNYKGVKIFSANWTQLSKCMSETGAIKFIKSIP